MKATTRLCWLQNANSLQEVLLQCGLSRNQLKNSELSKKQLQRMILAKQEVELPLELLNHGQIWPKYEGEIAPHIIQEDDWLLAVHKPARVHSHPLNYIPDVNVLSWLAQEKHFAPLKVNVSQMDRGLLYRLDYETSGLLLLAKSEELYQNVRNGNPPVLLNKSYLALAHGRVEHSRELKHWFSDMGAKGMKQKVSLNPSTDSREGELTVVPLQYSVEHDLTLVHVILKHGLRHQIRAQLAFSGHPLYGDPLYGLAENSKGLGLHAWKYELAWRGERRQYEDRDWELGQIFFDLNGRF